MSVAAPPAVHLNDDPELEEDDVEVPACHLLEPDGSALCGAGQVLGIPFGADVDVTASPCVSGCGRHRCDACLEALKELDGWSMH